MAVSKNEVAALRALLTGNFSEHSQLTSQFDDASLHDYMALVSAAFVEAVDQRFGGKDVPVAVIEYVGQVRSLNDKAAETIDPDISERVIMAALGHGSLSDVSGRKIQQAQNMLLPLLIRDEKLDGAGIDALLTSACAILQS
jgi:hypothetical protein